MDLFNSIIGLGLTDCLDFWDTSLFEAGLMLSCTSSRYSSHSLSLLEALRFL
jgi:hypothetical protein